MRLPAFLVLTALVAPLCAQGKVDFGKQVFPILEKRCVKCHGPPRMEDGRMRKPKGNVRFDTKDALVTSKRGRVVKPGDAENSLMFEAISLPADDEDRMPPPDEGAPLTAKEIDLLKRWIDEGADFGKWTGEDKAAAKDGGKSAGKGAGRKPDKAEDPLTELAKNLKPLDPELVAGFAKSPFRVTGVGGDSPLLEVTCYGQTDAVDDAALDELLPIATHIAALDLAACHVTDEGCATIAKMPRLVTLDLRRTEVADHGVARLAACKELRVLNLYGTKLGDYGMTALTKLTKLKELYVWQTEVTAAAVLRVREAIPGIRIVEAADLPEPMEETGNGRRQRGR